MLTRWALSHGPLELADTPGIRESDGKKVGALWLYRMVGTPSALAALSAGGILILPGLSTPAELLPQSVMDALGGIVPAPGEQLVNLLRRFRDTNSSETGESLDISLDS